MKIRTLGQKEGWQRDEGEIIPSSSFLSCFTLASRERKERLTLLNLLISTPREKLSIASTILFSSTTRTFLCDLNEEAVADLSGLFGRAGGRALAGEGDAGRGRVGAGLSADGVRGGRGGGEREDMVVCREGKREGLARSFDLNFIVIGRDC